MAEIQTIQQMIQGRVKDRTPEYLPVIDAAIKQGWATLAAMGDWWFLQQPTPLGLSMVATESQITVNKQIAEIGRMLYIANSGNRKVWTYKGTRSYQLYRTGGFVRNVDATEAESSETGTIQVFTVVGLEKNKPVIEVFPVPIQSGSYYLHYRESGTLANLDKLPERWGIALFHFAMSILAPPDNTGKNQWRATNYGENALALEWYRQMAHYEDGAVDGEEKEMDLDPHISQELDAIGNL